MALLERRGWRRSSSGRSRAAGRCRRTWPAPTPARGAVEHVFAASAVLTDGLAAVVAACAEALAEGISSANVILNILARRRDPGPSMTITTPDALRLHCEPAADQALLREAMLREQLEAWIEQRATVLQGLSPAEIAALQRLRARGPVGGPGSVVSP